MMQKVFFFVTTGPAGPIVELARCDERRKMEDGEHVIPVECMNLFTDETLPVGMDTSSVDRLVKRVIAIGYSEALARENHKDPYPPLAQVLLTEQEARTVDCLLQAPSVEYDGIVINAQKRMRSLERLRLCGRILCEQASVRAA